MLRFHQSVDGVNKSMRFVVIRWSTRDNPSNTLEQSWAFSASETLAVVSHLARAQFKGPLLHAILPDFSQLPLTIPLSGSGD